MTHANTNPVSLAKNVGLVELCHVTSIPQIKHGCHSVFIRSPSAKKDPFSGQKDGRMFDCIVRFCASEILFQANSATREISLKILRLTRVSVASVRVEIRLWSLPANGLPS